MNALAILICVGCLGAILYMVGADLIRDVLNDFWHLDPVRDLDAEDELEASWSLPTREPRR